MKNCINCNHKFTLYDRLKFIINLRGHLKCPQCNSVYKSEPSGYRAAYYFLVIFITSIGFDHLTFSSKTSRFILFMLTIGIPFLLFDVIPHRWQRFRKID